MYSQQQKMVSTFCRLSSCRCSNDLLNYRYVQVYKVNVFKWHCWKEFIREWLQFELICYCNCEQRVISIMSAGFFLFYEIENFESFSVQCKIANVFYIKNNIMFNVNYNFFNHNTIMMPYTLSDRFIPENVFIVMSYLYVAPLSKINCALCLWNLH